MFVYTLRAMCVVLVIALVILAHLVVGSAHAEGEKIEMTDFEPTGLTAPGMVWAGPWFHVTWSVQNRGFTRPGGEWTDALYLSLDDRLDSTDLLLGRFKLADEPNVMQGYVQDHKVRIPYHMDVPFDTLKKCMTSVNASPNVDPALPRVTYYLILVVNEGHQVMEMSYTNNQRVLPIKVIFPGQFADPCPFPCGCIVSSST